MPPFLECIRWPTAASNNCWMSCGYTFEDPQPHPVLALGWLEVRSRRWFGNRSNRSTGCVGTSRRGSSSVLSFGLGHLTWPNMSTVCVDFSRKCSRFVQRRALCKHFKKVENKKGNAGSLSATESPSTCGISCCHFVTCLGFDFNKKKGDCYLLLSNNSLNAVTNNSDFDHYVRLPCTTTASSTFKEFMVHLQTTPEHPMPKKSPVNHPVAIVCMRNCRGRPNVHEAIALKITSSLQPIVSTEWSINPAINWKRDTGSGNSRQFLSIYENVLQPGTKYNFTATVQIRQGTKRVRTFKISKPLHMATPPTLGTCSVIPRKGVFLQDKFAVNCSGFIDLTPPLTYMFYLDPREYKTSPHGLLMYVSVGKPFLPPMMLPTKHQHNYTATIRMVVVDGLAASTFLDVKFQLLRFGNKGTELRKMGELLTSLDAMSLAQSALATLRNASAETKELAPKWLNTITYFLTGIKDIYATTVLLKANVLKEITATSFNSTTNAKAKVHLLQLTRSAATRLASFQQFHSVRVFHFQQLIATLSLVDQPFFYLQASMSMQSHICCSCPFVGYVLPIAIFLT
ncbi:hypothetical protein LSAT2_027133 [Lamellibrachia satsuma]|nr:hypothetical protein LSAT2_027133 [Lamellibrachia satsuma]